MRIYTDWMKGLLASFLTDDMNSGPLALMVSEIASVLTASSPALILVRVALAHPLARV